MQQKNIRKLKYYSVFLLKDAEITFYDKPIEKDMEKLKYEQAVSECKKSHSLIKTVVGRKKSFLSKK